MMKQGWEYKKLGEVCDFQGGSQPPKSEWSKELKTNYIRMLQIRDFTQSATEYIEYVKSSKSLKCCEKDDILLARYGASVGKILSGLSGAYNVAIMKSMPNTDYITKPYIKYYFLSPVFQHQLSIVSQHRAAQAGFSKEDIFDFQLPIPPISQQQSIVAELDKINEIIDLKKAQLKDLDLLAQSIFYEMFGDPIENPKGWEVKRLGEVCKVGTGSTPNRKRSDYYEGLIPWVKSTEVANCRIGKTEEHISDIAIKETNCSLYPKGTILMAMYGQGKTRGQIAILDIDATTNQAVAAILPNKNLNIDYLYQYLHLQYDNIRSMARGGNQANLNLSLVKSISAPIPPLSLQQSFSSKIQSIESQKSAIKQSLAEVETLLASRMDYWFN